MREFHAFFGEPVEVGRVDFGAVVPEVGPAEIVGEDDNQIGRPLCGAQRGNEQGSNGDETEKRKRVHGVEKKRE